MKARWTLNRAGILNVYQYGDEILDFAGGRLLLRGVNGSGKSTAMNMILPFLLEADVRRIDAAGEQRGVLRSWMLNGRDEQQPIGYLWVEFERDGEYITCGCGIRANRSTERVTTWWFITAQRPGIDFSLVEANVPLNLEGLRFVLGHNSVFPDDQRQTYRSEVRSRLFGGADLDQHFTLLHVIRSPRVGDRIDSDLPSYLNNALPQLSDTAIDDAAQPLEDLEEHRRNVTALSATATALDALSSTYRSYARGELHRRAHRSLELVQRVHGFERAEKKSLQVKRAAEVALEAARVSLVSLEGEQARLEAEIDAMVDLPAYKAGKDLEDLRELVRTQQKTLNEARTRCDRSLVVSESEQASTSRARALFEADLQSLTAELGELRVTCAHSGLSVATPDAPTVNVTELEGISGPCEPFDPTSATESLAALTTALGIRRGDINAVHEALDNVAVVEGELRLAESTQSAAKQSRDSAYSDLESSRQVLSETVARFRTGLADWTVSTASLANEIGVTVRFDTSPLEDPRFIDNRGSTRSAFVVAVDQGLNDLRSIVAHLNARLRSEREAITAIETELAELESRTEPDIPRLAWQQHTNNTPFAQLVDFADGLDHPSRLGIEAALEAGGLLGADMSTDGLRATTGELLVRGNAEASPVRSPLSDLLTITIPESLAETIKAPMVDAILKVISTDLTSDASTVVTTNGEFRIGVLEGRSTKSQIEQVGATARAAALERRRVQVRADLDEARSIASVTESEADLNSGYIASLETALRELPGTGEVDSAQIAFQQCEVQLGRLSDAFDAATSEVTRREGLHADTLDSAHRLATTLQLPHTTAALEEVGRTLTEAQQHIRDARNNLEVTRRSCSAWSVSVDRWRRSANDVREAQADVARLQADYEPKAMRLATLEDSFGVEYAEIIESIESSLNELGAAKLAIPEARTAVESAVNVLASATAAVGTATDATAEARVTCEAELPRLRAALGVEGITLAVLEPVQLEVTGPGDAKAQGTSGGLRSELVDLIVPATTNSVDGVAALAGFLISEVPDPQTQTSADGVRQSLRQRRDTLGAGWDAEESQPDETLPMQIEVNGPIGRMSLPRAAAKVREQLQHQSSLLSAKEDQALRNLLQGLVASEVATKLHAARELVKMMNHRLESISTAHGIGASLRWRRRSDLDDDLAATIDKLSKVPDLRSSEENAELSTALSVLLENARRANPDAPYRQLIAEVLDYRDWHEMTVLLHRPGRNPERLSRRTALSEGEKKVVSYLPLFAAVAASCDALASHEASAPRFVLLDDAFAKVSEDNHPKLFGLLVELDLDFIATSERLWGTHRSVPELSIIEVIRDAKLGAIVLERARWDGHNRIDD